MVKSISKKNVDTIDARCRNGFRFDLQRFGERGEKHNSTGSSRSGKTKNSSN